MSAVNLFFVWRRNHCSESGGRGGVQKLARQLNSLSCVQMQIQCARCIYLIMQSRSGVSKKFSKRFNFAATMGRWAPLSLCRCSVMMKSAVAPFLPNFRNISPDFLPPRYSSHPAAHFWCHHSLTASQSARQKAENDKRTGVWTFNPPRFPRFPLGG